MSKEKLSPEWEHPVDWINWSAGVGRPAGVYLLDGDHHIATHGSPAEHDLLRRGALHVATLRFDRDPHERSHSNRPVDPILARAAALRFGGASRN